MPIERMDKFFTARVDGYDEHMTNNVEGCAEGYRQMAKLLPAHTKSLLDLGCGTGLELEEIFKRFPDACVTGIDLTRAMLEKLKEKFPSKALVLINGNYFDVDFGVEPFDAAVSFQTLHHFTHEEKLGLYMKIHKSLRIGGCYIECDYMVTDQNDEDFYYSENRRIRSEQGIPEGEFYHYDTPCTVNNQLKLLRQAGFYSVKQVWRMENTTIIIAEN